MSSLKIEHITYSYTRDSSLLDDISFQIDSGQVIGLFGDSGSGKTTLCKVITGFITNYEGKITVDDTEYKKGFNPVQLIFQHPEKIMNPRWNMKKILEESWTPNDDVLNEFGIKKEWFKRYPSELSGGELQRFSILRSINPKTKFIIADEITTMLDAVTQVQIWESLLKYAKKQDIGLLVVSHDHKLINRICDKIIYFDDLNK